MVKQDTKDSTHLELALECPQKKEPICKRLWLWHQPRSQHFSYLINNYQYIRHYHNATF